MREPLLDPAERPGKGKRRRSFGLRAVDDDPVRADYLDRITLAAIYLRDAAKGRALVALTDGEAVACRNLYHRAWYRRLIVAVAAVHMGLAVFEPATAGKASLLPTWLYLLIELLLLAAYAFDTWLQWRFMGADHFWRPGTARWKAVLTLAVAIDLSVALFMGEDAVRLTRAVRPALLVLRLRNVRNIFTGIANAFPQLTRVFALSAFQVLLYAIVGTLVFNPTRNTAFDNVQSGHHCSTYVDGCDDYFATLEWGMYQLWLTTQRSAFPGVMQPYYLASPWSAMFFVSFLLVNYFFLYKLFLATAYDSYKRHAELQYRSYLANQRASTHAAFDVLATGDSERTVSHRSWTDLVKAAHPSLPQGIAEQLFKAVDIADEGTLDFHAFIDVVELTALDVKKLVVEPYADTAYDQTRQAVAKILTSPAFDGFINLLIVACVAHMVGDTSAWANDVDIIYFGIFINEIGFKMWAMGPRAYLANGFNRLDVVAVGSSLLAVIMSSISNSTAVLQVILALRTLRVLRMIRMLKGFKGFFFALSAIVPVLLRVLIVLVCVIYSFAVIGMDSFSEALTESNENVRASAYGQNGLYDYNFDSFASTLLLLFQLLLVSKFGLYLEGLVAGTTPAYAYLYFVSFDLICVEFTVNVLVAFILEAYLSHARLMAQTERQGLQSRWKTILESMEPVIKDNVKFVLEEPRGMHYQHRAMFSSSLPADMQSSMMELTPVTARSSDSSDDSSRASISSVHSATSLRLQRMSRRGSTEVDSATAGLRAQVLQLTQRLAEKERECAELKEGLKEAAPSGSAPDLLMRASEPALL